MTSQVASKAILLVGSRQLVLGVDRDSQLLSKMFDERDDAVKAAVAEAIEKAHKAGIKIGICGQAPSDHPDFAAFLVECGIDTMSLNPDSVVTIKRRLAELEAHRSVSSGGRG